ncbi:MAG: carboxypeptidase regulatory-like domain-containing protein [Bacteroidetes bacterium]|nr:carboxypeptidase regulatory-like domain-containing protein [Bacteroidota bacterium]
MSLKRSFFILFTILNLGCLSAVAQQRDSLALTTLIDKTSKYFGGHPVEKVFLHFDKPYYALGDTLWVKAYVTTDLHVPSLLSKIVYIDFVSDQRVLMAELKLPLVNGVANSYLPLPSTFFKRGNYHVRAYTRWMRNFDDAYFFNKTISIGSTEQNQVLPKISFKNDITDKISKVNASVIYKDQDGTPYANKKVSWKAVTSEDDNLSKGRGETDANGKLDISFSTDKSQALATANIVVDMDLEDKKTDSKTFPIQTTTEGIDFQFFPEGGYMINGIRSRVAIKAVKPNGLSIESKGTITDDKGNVVANFASEHSGMGVFAIQPEDGKTYKANITYADGTHDQIDLPTQRSEGINLSLNNSNPDTLFVKIVANELYFEKFRNKAFYVIAQSHDILCYAAQTTLRNNVYAAAIPKSKFPTGVLQVTLFSSKGSPLGERVAFIRHNDLLNLAMTSDHPSYSRRQKVNMTVSAKNKTGPVEANLSVAVVDENIVPYDENDEITILSHLLLTSDLRGFIEKPNYYFNHPTDQTNADLDLLMLTQGYRRFSYRNIVADKIAPITFLPEQGIDISGTLRTNTGMPVNKGNVRLLIPDKNFSAQATTDVSGTFRFSNVIVPDTSKVTVTARDNPGGTNMVLTIDPIAQPPASQYVNISGQVADMDSTLHGYLQNALKQQNSLNQTHTLQEVVIKDKAAPKKVSHEDFPSMSGLAPLADHTISGDVFKGCPVFTNCLITAALGISYEDNNLYLTRDYNAGNKSTPVAIYVSGMAVDYAYLNNVNADMVESVEIFMNDGFSGINKGTGTKGVLEVNMKKPPKGEKISKEQLMDLLPKPYTAIFVPGGYNATRQFYMPRYDNPANLNKGVDLRSTIYWNPSVVTDKTTGNTTFEFYNADGTGTYRAIIQGIDKDGNIGWYVYRYKVQ